MLYVNRPEQYGSWDDLPLTRAVLESRNIKTCPVVYGGFDPNDDERISPAERQRFEALVEEMIPDEQYAGPACIDYEGTRWPELLATMIAPKRYRQIVRIYVSQLQLAHELRPNARWGFWGLPMMRHVGDAGANWNRWGNSIETIVRAAECIFPQTYDYWPDSDNRALWINFLNNCAETISVGTVVCPVMGCKYPQTATYVENEEFKHQQQAVRMAGVPWCALWDSQHSHFEDIDDEGNVFQREGATIDGLDRLWSQYLKIAYAQLTR